MRFGSPTHLIQIPIVSLLPWVTGYQLTVTSYQLPATSYQLPVTSYQLPATSYQLPVTSYQLPVASYQLPVTSYQLPVTSYQLPVTSYQLPVTSYQLPVTSVLDLPSSRQLAYCILTAWPNHWSFDLVWDITKGSGWCQTLFCFILSLGC